MTWVGVFLGGGLGSLLRYGLAIAFNSPDRLLPFGTVFVNILGCFVLGYFSSNEWVASRLTDTLRLAITTGLLGGFTTFSTFGLESVRLYQSGQSLYGTIYVLVSLLGGLAAALMGMKLAI
jgi:CrcB protein